MAMQLQKTDDMPDALNNTDSPRDTNGRCLVPGAMYLFSRRGRAKTENVIAQHDYENDEWILVPVDRPRDRQPWNTFPDPDEVKFQRV
ncbi:hypothetical protein [Rhodopirellula sp. SWK7]|uniref:hypothetical protein n=1 Tax=Rhodopirellula sp. SWK7 TaxID=595460 RepID=UPI001181B294|nr:hypothetical protein [Rhodopirellula sp. SWK7]